MVFAPKCPDSLPYAIALGNATNCVTSSAITRCVESMPSCVPYEVLMEITVFTASI